MARCLQQSNAVKQFGRTILEKMKSKNHATYEFTESDASASSYATDNRPNRGEAARERKWVEKRQAMEPEPLGFE
jgi:hypothetical protein